ncbi:MAG: tol-pal system-associated acyl-CoA thioesterase [Proteobacteria bacterium]|nr:tol-pal system-associated acyl-CoA thioesterase [Pseudomonadota bacterium]
MPSTNHDQGFRDGVHLHPLRVYYEDTDAGGVVYYANYLKFAERARTEMLRDLGVDPPAPAAREGVAFAVSRLEVDYLAPARLDDELTVQTRIIKLFAATLEAEQIISRGATECARLIVRLACVNRAGRPVRLPERILTAHRSVTDAPKPSQLRSPVKKRA